MLKLLEKAFVVFVLIYFSGGLILILQPDDLPISDEPPANPTMALLRKQAESSSSDPTQKNPIKLGTQILVYGVTALLVLRDREKFFRLAWRHKWLWIVLAFALVSALWSEVPGFTVRRGLVLIASTVFGVYLAERYTLREIVRILCIVGALAAVASLIVVWKKPDVGVAATVNEGAWQGIFGQKNTLGRFMAFETLVFFFAMLKEKHLRWIYGLGALLCLALVILARDISAALLLPVLLGLLPVFHFARTHSLAALVGWVTAIGSTAAAFFFLVIIEPSKLLHLLGKDSTLSGRTEIWSMVWDKIVQRPWLGYGYSGFWLGKEGLQSANIQEALHWAVPHSHNGFLDVLVEVGVIGLLLFLVGYAIFFRQALQCARISTSALGLLPLTYLSFVILTNCSEGTILKQESMFWVLYATFWAVTTTWLELGRSQSTRLSQFSVAEKSEQLRFIPSWQN